MISVDFLDIVMEAESKRKKAKEAEEEQDTQEEEDDDEMPEDIEPTDYSEEDPDNEEDETPEEGTEPDDETEPTDYSEGDDDSPELSDTEETPAEDVEPEEGTEPTDYSEDGGDGTEGGDGTPDENAEPTDYSDDGSGEEGTDDMGDGSDTGEVEPEAPQDDVRSVRLLLEDYINIYNRCKDFLTKMDNIDRSDAIVSQVVLQVRKNIERIKTVVWEYISYEYDKNNYVMNLYRYNQFIEAFKLNIQMLSRTKDYLRDRYEREDKRNKKSNKVSKYKNS